MDESEKTRVLKKAYAEIILNTAKEAAARIMASEKRVQQVNHELSSTKDEAFRLLLRLKQTMDSKITEAEMKSLHQQRRIEELEAQLQEAEDIVSNLRVELNEAHNKLEEIEKNQTHNWPNSMEKANYVCKKVIPDDVLTTQVNGQNNATTVDCTTTDSLGENGYIGVPDVPCVKGYTPTVHPYEGKFLNGHIPIAGDLDDLKGGKTLREIDNGKICKEPLEGSDVAHIVEKKLVNIVDVNITDVFSCRSQVSEECCKRRKCAASCRTRGTSFLKSLPSIDKEACSDLPNSQNCLSGLPGVLESHNNEVTVPLNVAEMGVLSEHVVGVQGDDVVAKAHTNAMEENKEVASGFLLEKKGSGDCSDVAYSNPELETKNVSSTSSDSEFQNLDEGFPNPRPKDSVLTYTFQRKRKKEALSSDDNILVSKENPVDRKIGKKQESCNEQCNSSSGAESSRDSRRMAQVARQLISLSEKKQRT